MVGEGWDYGDALSNPQQLRKYGEQFVASVVVKYIDDVHQNVNNRRKYFK